MLPSTKLPKFKSPDYAMWVGRNFYPTKEDYIKEAEDLGCCKKIPYIPDNAEIGVSRIFLIHKDGGKPEIFGWFILDGIIACSLQQKIIEEAKKSITGQKTLPVTALGARARTRVPLRGCGALDPPSYYFVGPGDITAQLKLRVSSAKNLPKMSLVEPPVPCKFLSRFRGIKKALKLWIEESK